jgi:hypothetical protein
MHSQVVPQLREPVLDLLGLLHVDSSPIYLAARHALQRVEDSGFPVLRLRSLHPALLQILQGSQQCHPVREVALETLRACQREILLESRVRVEADSPR